MPETPVQRTDFGEGGDDYSDIVDGDFDSPSFTDSPVQRDVIQRAEVDEPTFEQYDEMDTSTYDAVDDSGDNYSAIESSTFQPSSDTPSIQRRQSEDYRPSEMDERSLEGIGAFESDNSSNSVQRQPESR